MSFSANKNSRPPMSSRTAKSPRERAGRFPRDRRRGPKRLDRRVSRKYLKRCCDNPVELARDIVSAPSSYWVNCRRALSKLEADHDEASTDTSYRRRHAVLAKWWSRRASTSRQGGSSRLMNGNRTKAANDYRACSRYSRISSRTGVTVRAAASEDSRKSARIISSISTASAAMTSGQPAS